MMTTCVHREQEAGIAVITIDNPPVNASSVAVRQGLLEAVEQVVRDAAVHAAVIIGAGRTFGSGADIGEFDSPLTAPHLPDVIAAIEACDKPFIAAMQGAALGAGLELALGCDGRIAASGTQLGLPEVTQGIIPGAGGTQRLPRVVGMARALHLICTGECLDAHAAANLGLVDVVVDQDLLAAGVAYARAQVQHGKRRLRDLPVPLADRLSLPKRRQRH